MSREFIDFILALEGITVSLFRDYRGDLRIYVFTKTETVARSITKDYIDSANFDIVLSTVKSLISELSYADNNAE